jgi:molybdate transport system regulatory protein
MASHAKNTKERPRQPGWRGRVWLEGEQGTFIGYGRAVLLERIKEHGSISKAAKSMDMSYKHAWDLIRSMQHQAGRAVVETSRGGVGGGGARLTLSGEELLEYFWEMYQRFNHFLEEESLRWQEWQTQRK